MNWRHQVGDAVSADIYYVDGHSYVICRRGPKAFGITHNGNSVTEKPSLAAAKRYVEEIVKDPWSKPGPDGFGINEILEALRDGETYSGVDRGPDVPRGVPPRAKRSLSDFLPSAGCDDVWLSWECVREAFGDRAPSGLPAWLKGAPRRLGWEFIQHDLLTDKYRFRRLHGKRQ